MVRSCGAADLPTRSCNRDLRQHLAGADQRHTDQQRTEIRDLIRKTLLAARFPSRISVLLAASGRCGPTRSSHFPARTAVNIGTSAKSAINTPTVKGRGAVWRVRTGTR